MDATRDPALRSWGESANGHPDFPIQNLPLGVFSTPGGAARAGIVIGDRVLDLAVAGIAIAAPLNEFLAQGATPRPEWLHARRDVTMHLPVRIGDYTDFCVGIHHAVAAGRPFVHTAYS